MDEAIRRFARQDATARDIEAGVDPVDALANENDWMDTAPRDEPMGTPFAATYAGTCSVEGDRIHEAEMIQRTGDGYAHTFCIRNAKRAVVWE